MRHMKFSSESLYGWMESQLAGLYFSAYQLAYDLAKKAERAYQFELGDSSTTFIQFGHWDSLRKGLLSGERLSQNLRSLEAAHLERNKRELEITKHISLRQLDPLALMNLRETGECEFDVPEVLFDLDFPGHYFRRIKSVSVSAPCVVGPYSSVSGTLTLLSSKLRDKVSAGNYSNTDNYQASYLPTQSIATSSGQNDAGVFELNFRDERYLPFEGAGVISRWRFKLPENFRSFDYTTINDIVLHFRYTARNGGESLALAANENARTELNKLNVFGETDGLWQFIDLRHDYPEEWHRYNKSTSNNPVTIKLGYDRFPFMLRGQTINVQEIKHSTLPNREVSITIDPKIETVKIPLQEIDFNGQDVWIVLRYSI
jgi:Tc toxin complex TcA C-terminal TcB-binding domain